MNKTKVSRMIAGAVCIALAVSVCLGLLGQRADATTSLPYIEQMKTSLAASGGSFVILEIVPEDGSGADTSFTATGSIGYYITGQEPSANWLEAVAGLQSRAARETYASGMFSRLEQSGILGEDSATPLTYLLDESGAVISGYQEAYPWEEHTDMTELTLKTPETVSVTGTFSPAEQGDYLANWIYALAADGTYLQDVTKLTWGGEGDYFYESPTFTALTSGHVDDGGTPDDPSDDHFVFDEIADGATIYAAVTGMDETGAAIYETTAEHPAPAVLYYDCMGVVGEGLELDGTLQYYTMSDTGAPNVDKIGYAAQSAGWLLVGDTDQDGMIGGDETAGIGYFGRTMEGCTYVGSGAGDHFFEGGTGTDQANIVTSVLYYTGGYTNNNWFCRDVLDMDSGFDTMQCIVNSVTPDKVTAAMVSAADLLVLSGGYGGASYGVGFQAGVYDALLTAATTADPATPVLLDYALCGTSSQVGSLASAIYASCDMESDGDHTFVSSHVFCLSTGAGGLQTENGGLDNLVSPNFSAPILTNTEGLEAVGEEIQYENFLRKQQGLQNDLLPDTVTVARSLRYILNFSGRRIVEEKTAIRVLEVEPATGTQQLTVAMVKSWLPADTAVQDINITTMSVYEFIGKLEDLSETYDMIYLGDSLSGLKTSGGIADYYDNSMDGLLYTNVGDQVVTKAELAGMLNRDYSGSGSKQTLTKETQSYTFRYSGNDLTETRMNDIINFAKAGYPVVLGDNLVSTQAHSGQNISYQATLTAAPAGQGQATLSLSLADNYGNSLTAENTTWYQSTDGTNFQQIPQYAGSTLVTVVVPGQSQPAYYYCEAAVEGSTLSARSQTLKLYQDGTITVSYDTVKDSGSYEDWSSSNTLSTTLSSYSGTYNRNNPLNLTASALQNGAVVTGATYQWQWRTNYGGWNNFGGETRQYISITSGYFGYQFRCAVTFGGETVYTDGIGFRRGSGQNYSANKVTNGTTSTVYSSKEFQVSVSHTTGAGTITLNATSDASNIAFRWHTAINQTLPPYSYYWLSDSPNYTIDTNSFSGTETYYCYGIYQYGGYSYSTDYARSVKITVTKPEMGSSEAAAGTDGIYVLSDGVNENRVDNASYLYEGLDEILAYSNVMTRTKASQSQETIAQYLNLSKPEIVWLDGANSYPTAYEMASGGMTAMTPSSDGKYYLNYQFVIENKTDATPNTTTYDCRLYLDQDSSGRYTEEEQITDIVIRENGSIIRPVNGRYQLKADVTYTVSRQMPTSYAGIIPWKLEVAKNAGTVDSYIHASQTGYTRISGTANPQKIQILQIASSRTSALYHVNLEEQLTTIQKNTGSDCYSTVTGQTYFGIYGKLLADVTDFDISIKTVRADRIESYLGSTTAQGIYDELVANYNMIIIGYDDMYQELSQNAAQAIVQFIDSGKSVLFTHDTTSLSNVSQTVKSNSGLSFSNPAYWGYYFNSILRTPVGLDRYGIRSSLSGYLTGAASLTSAQQATLENAGFSVAYTPKSGKTTTVADAQGYSNYDLIRYMSAGNKFVTSVSANENERVTTTVSQLNQGQITTYPYDVNTALFSQAGTNNTMRVGATHEQPYQINLNSDDTVVWYCLSGNYYLQNDAMNAYYIYSKGNVTYSGMGHSASDTYLNYQGSSIGAQYVNEAKLFVNTMIAAYRTVNEAPSVKFTTDDSGNQQAKYYFLKSDGTAAEGTVLENDAAFGEKTDSTLVYFKLSDPNLNKDKVIGATLYYAADATEESYENATALSGVEVSLAETDAGASLGNLTGGIVYKFYLPSAVLDALGQDDVSTVRLYLHITTTIDQQFFENTAWLDIRKLSLSSLK